jgi:hypothetical protein
MEIMNNLGEEFAYIIIEELERLEKGIKAAAI